jgi:hypothetical protein
MDRFNVTAREGSAGNKNYHNYKVSIVNTISKKLSDYVVRVSEGIGCLISVIIIFPLRFGNTSRKSYRCELTNGYQGYPNNSVAWVNRLTSFPDFINTICGKRSYFKGIAHLIKVASILQPRSWEVKGFVNEKINTLPFELHVPGYSFRGLVPNWKRCWKEATEGLTR